MRELPQLQGRTRPTSITVNLPQLWSRGPAFRGRRARFGKERPSCAPPSAPDGVRLCRCVHAFARADEPMGTGRAGGMAAPGPQVPAGSVWLYRRTHVSPHTHTHTHTRSWPLQLEPAPSSLAAGDLGRGRRVRPASALFPREVARPRWRAEARPECWAGARAEVWPAPRASCPAGGDNVGRKVGPHQEGAAWRSGAPGG